MRCHRKSRVHLTQKRKAAVCFIEVTVVSPGSTSFMTRFTLVITRWRKYTEENWVSIELGCFTQRTEIRRVRKTPPLSHEVQKGPTCFLNSFWSLGLPRSNLNPRPGQHFMSKGKEEVHRVRNILLLSHEI